MSGFPVPWPIFQGSADDGTPLAGGKLYSFAAGTLTPLATYSDQALTTPNTNPTILDAAGRAHLYAQDGIAYDFVLKTAAGVQIWSAQNISVPQIAAAPAASNVPVGGLLMFGGSSAPAGYLLCDGTAVSRSTYAALFAAISTQYGNGNGSTTFNLPDLRQKFPMGVAASGTGSVLGGSGGAIDHVHAGPSHTHTIGAHHHAMAHTHSVPVSGYTRQSGVASAFPTHLMMSDGGGGGIAVPNADGVTGAATISNTGDLALTTDASGTANTGAANPPFVTVNFIIKT